MAVRVAVGRPPHISWRFYAWIAVLGALVILGLIGFVRTTFEGHHITGLSDTAPWGLYITGFVFFVGTSAGATVIGLMIHAFGREDYAPLGTRAIVLGLLSLMAAILLITSDVGRIERMIALPWLWRNPTSMFMYTSITYYVFGLMLLGELYFTVRVTRGVATANERKAAKWLAILAVPFALVILHAPHGALFAVLIARDFWNTPLMPPHFASAALVSGTAIMILVTLAHSWVSGRALVSKETLAHMGILLAWFIAITAVQDFFDFLVANYGGKAAANEAWHTLWQGHHIPMSVIHLSGYIGAFVILLFKWGRTVPWLTVAAAMTVVAVATFRYNLTTTGLDVPLFPFLEETHYSPSWVEISVVVGVVALAALLYTVITRVLPMEEESADSQSPT